MKNLLRRRLTILVILSLSIHCTRKSESFEIEIHDSKGRTEEASPDQLKNSLNVADNEIGKMMDQMSMTGFKDESQLNQLLKSFSSSRDKLEKFEICSQIMLAKVSYDLRTKLKKEIPNLSATQTKQITKAKQYCQWVNKQVKTFEDSLSESDYKDIAKDVPDSLVPYQMRLFSTNKKCTAGELKKLIEIDRKAYTNSKVITSVLIVSTMKKSSELEQYLPQYRKKIEDSQFPEKKFLTRYIEKIMEHEKTPLNRERRRLSIAKAMKSFYDVGIADIPKFIKQSVKLAPKCFSSVSSGVITLSKLIITGDHLKTLHLRLENEAKKLGTLPKMKPLEMGSPFMQLDTHFIAKLKSEKIAVRDQWFKPLIVVGDTQNFKIVSSGKDRKFGTKDDLVYPKL